MLLLQEAAETLTSYPIENEKTISYNRYIARLKEFFETFDETAFKLGKITDAADTTRAAVEAEKDYRAKSKLQQKVIGILTDGVKQLPDNKALTNRLAASYGSLAWYQLFTGQFTTYWTIYHSGAIGL